MTAADGPHIGALAKALELDQRHWHAGHLVRDERTDHVYPEEGMPPETVIAWDFAFHGTLERQLPYGLHVKGGFAFTCSGDSDTCQLPRNLVVDGDLVVPESYLPLRPDITVRGAVTTWEQQRKELEFTWPDGSISRRRSLTWLSIGDGEAMMIAPEDVQLEPGGPREVTDLVTGTLTMSAGDFGCGEHVSSDGGTAGEIVAQPASRTVQIGIRSSFIRRLRSNQSFPARFGGVPRSAGDFLWSLRERVLCLP